MSHNIVNKSNGDMSTLIGMMESYFPYAKKNIGFDKSVTVVLESDIENARNPLGKTAYYDPSNYTVVLYTDNRHPKDIMRSLNHELVHHRQNCNGTLQGITGEQGYAQTETGSALEEEAYKDMTFRNWEDSMKKQMNETSYNIKRNKKMKLTKTKLRKMIKEVIKKTAAKRTETALESTKELSKEEDTSVGVVDENELNEGMTKFPQDAAWQQAIDMLDPKQIGSLLNSTYHDKGPLAGHELLPDWSIMRRGGADARVLADEWELKLRPEEIAPFAEKVLTWYGHFGTLSGVDSGQPSLKAGPASGVGRGYSGVYDPHGYYKENLQEEKPLKGWWNESLYTNLIKKYTKRSEKDAKSKN